MQALENRETEVAEIREDAEQSMLELSHAINAIRHCFDEGQEPSGLAETSLVAMDIAQSVDNWKVQREARMREMQLQMAVLQQQLAETHAALDEVHSTGPTAATTSARTAMEAVATCEATVNTSGSALAELQAEQAEQVLATAHDLEMMRRQVERAKRQLAHALAARSMTLQEITANESQLLAAENTDSSTAAPERHPSFSAGTQTAAVALSEQPRQMLRQMEAKIKTLTGTKQEAARLQRQVDQLQDELRHAEAEHRLLQAQADEANRHSTDLLRRASAASVGASPLEPRLERGLQALLQHCNDVARQAPRPVDNGRQALPVLALAMGSVLGALLQHLRESQTMVMALNGLIALASVALVVLELSSHLPAALTAGICLLLVGLGVTVAVVFSTRPAARRVVAFG